jgi:uroporphyrinogen-III synthase
VDHFHARFNLPSLLDKFPRTRLASIGPETTKAIAALGLSPAIEAKPHTMEGLVAALLKANKARPGERQSSARGDSHVEPAAP